MLADVLRPWSILTEVEVERLPSVSSRETRGGGTRRTNGILTPDLPGLLLLLLLLKLEAVELELVELANALL